MRALCAALLCVPMLAHAGKLVSGQMAVSVTVIQDDEASIDSALVKTESASGHATVSAPGARVSATGARVVADPAGGYRLESITAKLITVTLEY